MLAKALKHRWIVLATLLVMGGLAVGLLFGIGPNNQVSAQQPPCNTTIAGGDCPGVAHLPLDPLPVPAAVIVLGPGNLEWVWAAPCARNAPAGFGCHGTTIDVGRAGFNYATPAQWGIRPPIAAFGNPVNCASPWFTVPHHHCDLGDALLGEFAGQGTFGSAPAGGLPSGPSGLLPMHPQAETWLVRTADPHVQLEAKLDKLEKKADGLGGSQRDIKVELRDVKAEVKDIKAEVRDIKVEIRDIKAEVRGHAEASAAAHAATQAQVRANAVASAAAHADIKVELRDIKVEIRDIKAELRDVKAEVKKLQETVDNMFKFIRCLPSSRSVHNPVQSRLDGCP